MHGKSNDEFKSAPKLTSTSIPPAFVDVPTDADYAMQLITERVAAGLDVRPPKRKHNKHNRSTDGGAGPKDGADEFEDKERSIDWKKWGERAAIGKTWADDGKRLLSGHHTVCSSRI